MEDTYDIHVFIDSSKQVIGDVRHRSLYHHTLGAFLAEKIFGTSRLIGRTEVPVREIVEKHILEDLGWIPSPKDYIDGMLLKPWMSGTVRKTMTLDEALKGK